MSWYNKRLSYCRYCAPYIVQALSGSTMLPCVIGECSLDTGYHLTLAASDMQETLLIQDKIDRNLGTWTIQVTNDGRRCFIRYLNSFLSYIEDQR